TPKSSGSAARTKFRYRQTDPGQSRLLQTVHAFLNQFSECWHGRDVFCSTWQLISSGAVTTDHKLMKLPFRETSINFIGLAFQSPFRALGVGFYDFPESAS